uniref:K8 n=1 Tax=Human herpesvirus 8 TaxID=37296 RepID=A0A7D3UI31_HHV8|nr:K8 [Human gammaherpesvirus 8]
MPRMNNIPIKSSPGTDNSEKDEVVIEEDLSLNGQPFFTDNTDGGENEGSWTSSLLSTYAGCQPPAIPVCETVIDLTAPSQSGAPCDEHLPCSLNAETKFHIPDPSWTLSHTPPRGPHISQQLPTRRSKRRLHRKFEEERLCTKAKQGAGRPVPASVVKVGNVTPHYGGDLTRGDAVPAAPITPPSPRVQRPAQPTHVLFSPVFVSLKAEVCDQSHSPTRKQGRYGRVSSKAYTRQLQQALEEKDAQLCFLAARLEAHKEQIIFLRDMLMRMCQQPASPTDAPLPSC